MKNFKDTIFWKIIKNKFFIVCFVFFLIILFLDENNLFVIRSLKKDVAQLEFTIDTMRQGIYQDSLQAERLKYNLDTIERYGRENYYMKRKNEDVFVVVEDKE
ncbi:MAG: septum formation initiator family protein [Bacteroidales bacterium]|nr:septum formation initiator family protein [Bacteroidales bacterium]MBR3827800.1 septum formation initiator family protein [Bacteroidales bacterium]MBR6331375.1 septum formation initiator family protein [Bacteroidales bacterium]